MKLAIASLADPHSPGTWSGVPFRVSPALEREGVEPVPLGVRAGLPLRLLAFGEYQLRLRGFSPLRWALPSLGIRRSHALGRSDYLRLRSMHKRHGARVTRRAVEGGIGHVLHMGGLTLPLDAEGHVRHHLLCDATWNTLLADVARDRRFPGRLASHLQTLERESFGSVSHFFAISEHVAADLRSSYGIAADRITVVGSGPGWIEPYHGDKEYERREVLFVCRERFEEKGGLLLWEAFRDASPDLPGATLTLVTDKRPRGTPDLPAVSWRHTLYPGPELERLFREASLYAMPSLIEPWGLVYLEALASKTPILGLRRHAFPEIAGDGKFGFLVERATPDAVSEALVAALADPGRLRRMAEEGQRHILSTYSWDRVAGRIADVVRAG